MSAVVVNTPVGAVEISEKDGVIVSIRETDSPASCETPCGILAQAKNELEEYFSGERTKFTFPVAPDGTEFQKSVWRSVATVQYGYTSTYGEIAAMIGRPESSRAVAGAIGRNPLLFVVPCHRVVASRSIGGFRLGIRAKLTLLGIEKGGQVS